ILAFIIIIISVKKYGVSAGKRDQIDKKFFFEIINDLYQMIKSTSILLRNFFFKKKPIWSLFPALTPSVRRDCLNSQRIEPCKKSHRSWTSTTILDRRGIR